jgi:hypothetical protein
LPVTHTEPDVQVSPIGSVPTHPVPAVLHCCGDAHEAVQQRLPSGVARQLPAPAAHDASLVHDDPVETFALHAPASQNAVATQSPSVAQLVLQPPGAHV